MAENLGEAQLRLTVDLTAFEASLQKAKSLIDKELGSATARPVTRNSSTSRSGAGQSSGELTRFIEEAKALNTNTSWGKALRTLAELNSDLGVIGAGKDFNIASSWTKALTKLEEIDTDLRYTKSGKNLNLKTSWGRFLSQLETVKADIDATASRAAKGATSARNRKLREAGSNALIGGAFPLLFGQGIGASVGGGLGGAVGGLAGGQFGFGASLVGTAIGQTFDNAIAGAKALASALNDPIGQFGALKEASLISSKALESEIQALIDTGRTAEAAALIQQDLVQKYGSLEAAGKLAKQSDELNRTWANLTTRLAEFVAGPAADFIAQLNRVLGGAPGGDDGTGQPKGISFGSFREQVDQTAKERGRGVAANLVRRQIAERNQIVREQERTGGMAAVDRAAASEQASKRVLEQAAAEGIITKEQAKQNQQLAAARANYGELNTLAFRQIAAQAQGNKEQELTNEKLRIKKQLDSDVSILKNTPADTIKRQSLNDKAKQDIFALDEQLRTLKNGSLTDLQDQLNRLNSQRLSVPVDSGQFVQLGLEIDSLKTRIDALQQTPLRLDSIAGLQQQLSDLEARQTKLSVDSSAFTEANKKILETQNALEQLNGKKALITVEQINAGVQNGTLTNNFSNLEKRSQAAKQALNTAAFGSPEYYQAARASQEANFELGMRQRAADPSAIKQALTDQQAAAEGVRSAFKNVEQAADGVTQAHRAYRSALEASFDLLTQEKQAQILGNAREDLRRAVDSGLFKRDVLALEGKDLVSAAQQARGIFNAEEDIGKANARLADANEALRKSVEDLNKKNWDVKVLVDAATGNYTTNLG